MRNAALAVLSFCLLSVLPAGTMADDLEPQMNPSTECQDNGVLSNQLITHVCWGCLFPIRMGGATLGSGNVPDGANSNVACSCPDSLGLPRPGMSVGYWEPARLIDVVREPGCAMSLGGMSFPGVDRKQWGTRGPAGVGIDKQGFHHYRYFAFPLLLILDLFIPGGCMADGMSDFDLLYLSEFDPTWNDEELAFFTAPESAAVSSPASAMACGADSAAAATGNSIDELWWCAGSWGNLYPLTGHGGADGMPRMTSLSSMRAVAALHRRGLTWRTMGSDTMCEGRMDPFLPKSQYRKSMFFPRPEASSNHVFGETTLNWGKGRTFPRTGEDATYLLWRWNDCCNVF